MGRVPLFLITSFLYFSIFLTAPSSIFGIEILPSLKNSNRISFNQLLDTTKPACSDVDFKDGKLSKLGTYLKIAHCGFDMLLINSLAVEKGIPAPEIREIPGQAGEFVVIDAYSNGDPDALKEDLERLGAKRVAAYENIVSALFPKVKLPALAALKSLAFAKQSFVLRNAGLVTGQHVQALPPVEGILNSSHTGTGINIGIISDSFDCLGGAAAGVASGDLPTPAPGATVLLDDLSTDPITGDCNSTDEGRGMAELIHDVAPGANLGFHTAAGVGLAGFAQGIEDLAGLNPGSGRPQFNADVIVDDIINLAESMLQDGIIAQAVDNVVANGVAYFSAAANQGRQSYEGTYRESSFTVDGNGCAHDFNPDDTDGYTGDPMDPNDNPCVDITEVGGVVLAADPKCPSPTGLGDDDPCQCIDIPNTGPTPILILQWDQPVEPTGSSINDLSFCYFSEFFYLVSSSFLCVDDPNIGPGNVPIQGLIMFPVFGTGPSMISIQYDVLDDTPGFGGMCGDNPSTLPNPPGFIKYVYFANILINEYDTASSTLYGHANAAEAEAVGAAAYFNTPTFGVDPAVLNTYSSAGGTPILFNTAGMPIGPVVRQKPEVVGPDGSNTTVFPDITDPDTIDYEPDGFPNFFGTSAAAPNVAAVAALMLQCNSSLTPAQIYSCLETTADDIVERSVLGVVPPPVGGGGGPAHCLWELILTAVLAM